jgi:uncharacterized protein (UPF0335 family)
MTIGQNTPNSQKLEGIIHEIEEIRATKKALSESETAIFARAKAEGYHPATMRTVLKRRAAKPSVVEEADTLLDIYLHSLGMLPELPLFRQVTTMVGDKPSRDLVLEALKSMVPDGGSIVLEHGGQPVRLTRGEDGEVTVTEVNVDLEETRGASGDAPRPVIPNRPPPPECDGDGAEQLGRDAFRANSPIVSNPFPYGDARRPRWDKGWRDESGSDGMGPAKR